MNDFQTLDNIKGITVEILGKDFIPYHHSNYNLLSGNGGTGKSIIALKMMAHFLMEIPNKKALGIFSEDTKSEIMNRLNNITANINITTQDIKNRTFFKTLDNDDGAVFCRKEGRVIVDTDYLTEFKKNLIKHDVGMVILDPLERFHTGLSENDESDMKHLMVLFQKIAIDCNVAVLVLHHTSKGDKSGYRGSSVIVNKGRVAYNIRKNVVLDKDLGVEKVREGWEASVVLSTIKDNHYISRYCDVIQNNSGKLDLPVKRDVPTYYQDQNGTHIGKPVAEVEYKPSDEDLASLGISMPDTSNDRTRVAVNISIASHNNAKNPKGFKKKTIAWDEILDVITMGRAYSPSFFKDDHRSNSNYLGGNEVIFLDIDDGLTIAQAKDMFSDLDAIIVTTKSHQKEKNGIVCDRFRVVIRLDEPMNLSSDEYRSAMTTIFNYFGSVADKQTSDPARFFFSSPTDCEVYYTGGSKTFQWREVYEKAQRIAEIERQSRMSESPKQYTDTTIQDAANALNKIDPDCDYETWFQIGMALQSEFSDAGFQVWDDWSRRGSKYCGEREIQNKWKSFKGSGVGIGTLFHHAKTLGGVS